MIYSVNSDWTTLGQPLTLHQAMLTFSDPQQKETLSPELSTLLIEVLNFHSSLLCANVFNEKQSEILSFGEELTLYQTTNF